MSSAEFLLVRVPRHSWQLLGIQNSYVKAVLACGTISSHLIILILGSHTMLEIAGLVVAASMVVGQADVKVPKDALEQMEFLIGDWTLKGKMNDDKYDGRYSARWTAGKDSLILTFRSDLLTASGIGGWDAATKEIVETWYSPSHGRLELRYKVVSDDVWEGTSVTQEPDGKIVKGKIRLKKNGNDGFTYTEKGEDISVVNENRRVKTAGISNFDHLKDLSAFIGEWETSEADGGNTTWTFAWSRDKNFINNTATTYDAEGNVKYVNNGMLGWDKSTKSIVNWFVNGNGGRTSYMWRQLETGKWDIWSPTNLSNNWTFSIVDADSFSTKTKSQTKVFKRRN